jgi:NAD-dependent dihydropyrimidine dehydrogenase PreA subunit
LPTTEPANKIRHEGDTVITAYKWLPAIDQDACTGCGGCVQVCPRKCLDLIWDFSTLKHPQDCCSEGHCVPACPQKIIRMDWIHLTGDRAVGQWREIAERQHADPRAGRFSLLRLLRRWTNAEPAETAMEAGKT